jgi:hypothetical protein
MIFFVAGVMTTHAPQCPELTNSIFKMVHATPTCTEPKLFEKIDVIRNKFPMYSSNPKMSRRGLL